MEYKIVFIMRTCMNKTIYYTILLAVVISLAIGIVAEMLF